MKHFKLHFETLSDIAYLPFLTRLFRALRAPQARSLTQILVEAYTNAVIHAHQREKGKWIGIEISLSPKKAVLRVLDRGPGLRNPFLKKKFSRWRTHGRGLLLIRAHADKVRNKKEGRFHIVEAVKFYE